MTAIDTDRLHSRLTELMAEHKVPGASLGILQDGEITEVAAGLTNKREGIEVTTDTVFQIGSITKSWTATVVMQLVDEGVLDLDTPVRTYLPDFKVADPDVSDRVTLRHFLAHTSGIQGDHFADTGRGDDCLEKYVASCAELTQTHPLGATMSYCNSGYNITGRLLEVVLDTTWDAAMKERLFTPLGLTHTSTLPEEAILRRAAVGHMALEPGADPEVAPIWVLPRNAGPAGLINSTARDTLTFARLHLDDGRTADGTQLLSPGAVKAMQEPQVDVPDRYTLGDQWGLGWILFHWGGRFLYGHDGATIGQGAFLRILPDAKLAIALLTNGGGARNLYQQLYTELLQDLAGVEVPATPAAPDTPLGLDLSAYAGTFERLGVKAEFTADDGRLSGTLTMSGPLASMLPNPVQQVTATPVDDSLFLAVMEGAETPTPLVFFDFQDGRPQYFHMGARAMPRVS